VLVGGCTGAYLYICMSVYKSVCICKCVCVVCVCRYKSVCICKYVCVRLYMCCGVRVCAVCECKLMVNAG